MNDAGTGHSSKCKFDVHRDSVGKEVHEWVCSLQCPVYVVQLDYAERMSKLCLCN